MNKKVANWRILLRRPALTYSKASAALRRALEQKDLYLRRVEVKAALPAYRAICQRALLAKLNQAVDGAEDVLDQLELVAACDYAAMFFESDPLLQAAEAVLAGTTPPSTRELNDEQFEKRLRCLNELRRIHRNRRPKR
jgi:hypothetical protein